MAATDHFWRQAWTNFCARGLPLDAAALARFQTYYTLLDERSKVMNLTAIHGETDVAQLHFLDSAALLTVEPLAGKSVIDVGTGSGILAIGAAMLGAKDVLAIDIDPVAVRVAKENIEHNHLSDRVRAVEGNLLASSDGVCDLCVANIIADVICMFAQPLVEHIVPGGLFICSGIIKEREQDVVNALTAADYTILETKRKGEWVAMLSRRKK